MGKAEGQVRAKEGLIPRSQPPGVVISLPANHHAVKLQQLSSYLFGAGNAAVRGVPGPLHTMPPESWDEVMYQLARCLLLHSQLCPAADHRSTHVGSVH